MTRKSRIRSKRSVSRKIRGSRRRVQRGGNWVSDMWKKIRGEDHPDSVVTSGVYSPLHTSSVEGTASVAGNNQGSTGASTVVQKIGDAKNAVEGAVSGVTDTVSNLFAPSKPEPVPVPPSGQMGGKRRRRPQTHIRLNRKYISRKMNNIIDIFRKHLTCKNKGKNKKSRRHYRGGAYGKYPGAVGNINVPMQSRP